MLVSRGYCVDVVQFNDAAFRLHKNYDLMIVHPGVVSQNIQGADKTGFRLCLRTGCHLEHANRVVGERYALLRQRRGVTLNWRGYEESSDVYKGFDAIACFDGDRRTAATFKSLGLPVYAFRNYANPFIKFVEKDMQAARLDFIYMASVDSVRKGLDWLLEIFAVNPQWTLHVCGPIDRAIERIYNKELALCNIHVYGHVDHSSKLFRTLCERSAWYVSPSASEGCQGTALDMMAAGLIPILSDACGVDVGGTGLLLSPCTPDVLKDAIEHAGCVPPAVLEALSRQARACVEASYSVRCFEEDWRGILARVEGLT
jgi:glycosyltransferase involved in cell wall biosynthesis